MVRILLEIVLILTATTHLWFVFETLVIKPEAAAQVGIEAVVLDLRRNLANVLGVNRWQAELLVFVASFGLFLVLGSS